MRKEAVILVVESDEDSFSLIKSNLQRAGIWNEIINFADGQEVLDFLFRNGERPKHKRKNEYLLLLDVHMPKMDEVEVLERIKQDTQLKKIPVIILTAADDALTIERCHNLGCSIYIVKPADYDSFMDAIWKVGLFLSVVSVPRINAAK